MEHDADAFREKLEAAKGRGQEVPKSAVRRVRGGPDRQWLYQCELLSEMTSVSTGARLVALNNGLKGLGQHGWELCAVIPWDNDALLVFKRPSFQ
jgi:hypothetical protein